MINIKNIDLQLLLALDALISEESVSRAADRLHMSQPSMSQCLAKLRHLLNDPVLIRSNNSMIATERARQIAHQIRPHLNQLIDALGSERSLNLVSSDRVLTIGMTDYVELMVMPRVMLAIREAAPKAKIITRPMISTYNIGESLASGYLDMAVGFPIAPPDYLRAKKIGSEEFVCISRSTSSDLPTMGLEDYLAVEHVTVSPGGDLRASRIDKALARMGCERNIVYCTSNFFVAAALVESSGLHATIQSRLACKLSRKFDISIRRLPFQSETMELLLLWHERTHSDPLLAWVREVIERVTIEVLSAPEARGPG